MPYTTLGLPFAPQSETSHDAALKAARFVGEQGLAVLTWFRDRGEIGGTQRECSEALRIGRPSICARVRALEQAGEVRKTDRRRHGCQVYVAA